MSRDNFGLISKSSDIEALARAVKDKGGIYFVPAFSCLSNAQRRNCGTHTSDEQRLLGASCTRSNRVSNPRSGVEAMEKDSGIALDVLRTDGLMVDDDLLMQFQADLSTGWQFTPAVKETTALGAAYAAGLEVRFYKGFRRSPVAVSVDHTWQPHMEAKQREATYSLSDKPSRDRSIGSNRRLEEKAVAC